MEQAIRSRGINPTQHPITPTCIGTHESSTPVDASLTENQPVRRILRLPKVIDRTGASRSFIYASIKNGKFPRPIHIGPRSVGWVEEGIDKWIAERVKASVSSEEMHDMGCKEHDEIGPASACKSNTRGCNHGKQ
jgi:prophage regulatory protein